MKTVPVLAMGAAVHAAVAATVYFAPGEFYKGQIVIASAIRGALVGLLVGFSAAGATWLRGGGWGVVYGLATALVIFFAKGGLKSKDAPYVIPSSLITGFITGALVAKFGF